MPGKHKKPKRGENKKWAHRRALDYRIRSDDAHFKGDDIGSFLYGNLAKEAKRDASRPASKRRNWVPRTSRDAWHALGNR